MLSIRDLETRIDVSINGIGPNKRVRKKGGLKMESVNKTVLEIAARNRSMTDVS